jgi:hypothetical protein
MYTHSNLFLLHALQVCDEDKESKDTWFTRLSNHIVVCKNIYLKKEHFILEKADKAGCATDIEFDFVDYAPVAFRRMRELWGINEDKYFRQLCEDDDCLQPMTATGRSGAFFYISKCKQFIIKTIKDEDVESLLHILEDLLIYQTSKKDTLLLRFFGLHKVKRIHFIVTQNVYFSPFECLFKFDLKGSTTNRQADKNSKDVSINSIFLNLSILITSLRHAAHL